MKILSPAFLLAEQPHDPSGESFEEEESVEQSEAMENRGKRRRSLFIATTHHPAQHPQWARLSLSLKKCYQA